MGRKEFEVQTNSAAETTNNKLEAPKLFTLPAKNSELA
jgi:hypothetical protein